jgi:hypothetical protein
VVTFCEALSRLVILCNFFSLTISSHGKKRLGDVWGTQLLIEHVMGSTNLLRGFFPSSHLVQLLDPHDLKPCQ